MRTHINRRSDRHDHAAAHLRLTPRHRLRVARDRGDLPRRLPRHPPGRRDRRVGPVGRHAARRSGPAAAAAKMDVFAGADPQGDEARGLARGHRHVRPLRRRRPLPVQRAHVERRRALHPQAVHRRGQPARPRLRLRPGARLHRPAARARRPRCIYTSAVYGAGPRPRVRRRLPAPVLRRLAALGGHRRRHRASSSGPTSRPADADTGRRAAHAAARDAGKMF